MRDSLLERAQRIIVVIIVLALGGIVLVGARVVGVGSSNSARQGFERSAFAARVALISGHAGYDSGAVCEESETAALLTEASVNAGVTTLAAERLRSAGADVLILDEFDPRLDELEAEVLLSIHSDSCVEATGYKAAHAALTTTPMEDVRLVGCIDRIYPAATGLAHHPNTVTHNMTDYHAFREIAPTTPAAIIELGFLGGDRTLLETQQSLLAQAVADSILCFLRGEGGDTPINSPADAAPPATP